MISIPKLQFAKISFSLSSQESYLNMIESFLENELRELDIKFEELKTKKANANDEDDYQELSNYEDWLIDDWQNLEKHVSHNFRSSFAVQLFSLIEHNLKELCDYISAKKKTEYTMVDLTGSSDLERAKTFLVRTGKVDFAKLSPEWGEISTLRLVRNAIVHHNSRAAREEKVWKVISPKLNNWFKLEEGDPEKLDRSGQLEYAPKYAFTFLISSKEMNEHYLALTKSFFKKLTSELNF